MDAPEKKKQTGAAGAGAAKPAASNKGNSAPRKHQTHNRKKKPQLPPTTWERTFLRYVTGASWMDEPNYLFYTGRLQSVPEGDWIDQVHIEWFWNYDLLEAHHGYIQWLFPIFEGQGMNFGSYRLLKEEARKMRTNFACNTRFLHSYKLMLNFYGLRLVNYETGELERTEEYEERFLNLNYCSHNNLRISRILIALGEHGFGRYKPQLLGKLREEIEEHGHMPECKDSLAKFWTFLVEGEDTPKYVEKTKESPEDRAEAVFFKHQKAQDRVYQKWEQDEQRWTETLQEARERMRDKLDEARARRMKDFEKRAELFADMERDRAKARAQKARQQQQQQQQKQQKKEEEEESKLTQGKAKAQRSRKGKEKRGDDESSSDEEQSEPEETVKAKEEDHKKEEEEEKEDVKQPKTPKQDEPQDSSSSDEDDDDDSDDGGDGGGDDKKDQSKGDEDGEEEEEEESDGEEEVDTD